MAGLAAGVNVSMITSEQIDAAFEAGDIDLLNTYKNLFLQQGFNNLTNSQKNMMNKINDYISQLVEGEEAPQSNNVSQTEGGRRRRKSKSRKHKKSKKARKQTKSKKSMKSRKH